MFVRSLLSGFSHDRAVAWRTSSIFRRTGRQGRRLGVAPQARLRRLDLGRRLEAQFLDGDLAHLELLDLAGDGPGEVLSARD
jgi:hypothetical protein